MIGLLAKSMDVSREIWHDVMLAAHNIKPLDTEDDDIGSLIEDNVSADSIGDLIEEENLDDSANSKPSTLEGLLDNIF